MGLSGLVCKLLASLLRWLLSFGLILLSHQCDILIDLLPRLQMGVESLITIIVKP